MAGTSLERPFRTNTATDERRGIYVLLYDADCGICTAMRNWIFRLGLGGRIRTVPIGSADAEPYLGRLSEGERFGSMHLVAPNGERTTGGLAAVRLLEAMPVGLGLARLLSARASGVALVDRGYRFLVRLRDRLGR